MTIAHTTRPLRWRAPGAKRRAAARRPTVIPTRSSYLQRLLWLFMP
jgi:hypothetical protein